MKHIKLIIWIINSLFIVLIMTGIIGIAVKPHWTWEEWLLVISISCLVLFNLINFIKWIIEYIKKTKEVVGEYKKHKKESKSEKVELKTPNSIGNTKIVEIKNVDIPLNCIETPIESTKKENVSIYSQNDKTPQNNEVIDNQ